MSAVLVADDEAGMRETLADILAESGYGVTSAADGDAALLDCAALALVAGAELELGAEPVLELELQPAAASAAAASAATA